MDQYGRYLKADYVEVVKCNTLKGGVLAEWLDRLTSQDFETLKAYCKACYSKDSYNLFRNILARKNLEITYSDFNKLSVDEGITLAPPLLSEIKRFGKDMLILQAGFYMEEKKWKVNKDKYANFLMKRLEIVVKSTEPEQLYIYDMQIGFYVPETFVLKRIMTYYLNELLTDKWTERLEKSILELIKRKATTILESSVPSKFAFSNVTFNQATLMLEEHSPKNYLFFGSNAKVDPEGGAENCPKFLEFLGSMFDEKTVLFIQEFFGYVLSDSFEANIFLIAFGDGANGKSTLFQVLEKVIDNRNISNANLDDLNRHFGLQSLIGRKFNVSSEGSAENFGTSRVKAITAGEPLLVDQKNIAPASMILPTKLCFLVNKLPVPTESTYGFSRRLILLPFSKIFVPHEQDSKLAAKLENEIPGIIMWTIAGLKRLKSNDFNFTVSESMRKAKENYLHISNPVADFIEETIIVEVGARAMCSDILERYEQWKLKNEELLEGAMSPQMFWKKFKEAYFERFQRKVEIKKSGGIRYVSNCKMD
ncbi:phage/plasmid primase, P4 family [uncultured Vagococcus sp.]|uniref:DNA primase family protein n=1 Tax=uncultured Vagococcus sp. TaxID=189676 RepID=UPI0028D205D6|nr:phage/plasmid primase, P4 family [uncultured Vagococcus sp.]